MNKALYEFCQRKFKTSFHGKLKLTGLLTNLNQDYGFGVIDGDYLHFTEQQRAALITRVLAENNAHLFRDPYPAEQSRQQIAKTQRNEKNHSYAVSRDFVLINAMQPLQLNKEQFPTSPFTSLGIYLKADEIISIEHTHIVLVENLEIMANLSALNIPKNLQNALWVYRGDVKKQQQSGTAYQFFRRFQHSHQLICFSDLDPKGIEIALSSGAHQWLTTENDAAADIELQGDENEWFKQQAAIKYLKNRGDLAEKCQSAFAAMLNTRKTLKQEQMLAHHLKLALYKL